MPRPSRPPASRLPASGLAGARRRDIHCQAARDEKLQNVPISIAAFSRRDEQPQ